MAHAAHLSVYGAPGYDPMTQTGLKEGSVLTPWAVNNQGIAVGYAHKYIAGEDRGARAVRWGPGDTEATELGNLGTDADGLTYAYAYAVNNAGTIAGYAGKYSAGTFVGSRGARWVTGTAAATELGDLGEDPNGKTYVEAYAVNDNGTIVGWGQKYTDGTDHGVTAALWASGSEDAMELAHPVTDIGVYVFAYAYSVNDAGVAAGHGHKYDGATWLGPRAIRWDAGAGAGTELGNLGLRADGFSWAYGNAVNNSGVTVGYATKYVDGNDLGTRAVLWAPAGTVAMELPSLGIDGGGSTAAEAVALNEAGVAVGYAGMYEGGIGKGRRATRWDPGAADAVVLGTLGTGADGYAWAEAHAIDEAGTVVGYAHLFVDGDDRGSRATLWGLDGLAVDLNTLIDPNSGWTLRYARAISENGQWIAGLGRYDPDGPGGYEAYERLFLLQIPEPSTSAFLAGAALVLARALRRHSGVGP